MTCFDLAIANRVAAYLAGRGACIEGATLLDLEITLSSYPEIKPIIGEAGFQNWPASWEWIVQRVKSHRLLMGEVSAWVNRRRYAFTEDDGA